MPKSVIRTKPSWSMSTFAGFQVAVEDALGVGGREPVAELLADVDDFLDGSRPMRRTSVARSSPSTSSME